MNLFDKLVAASEMIEAFRTRTELPYSTVFTAWKNLEQSTDEQVDTTLVLHQLMTIQSFVKLSSKHFSAARCKEAFTEIFARFDLDEDSLLNIEEFNSYQIT